MSGFLFADSQPPPAYPFLARRRADEDILADELLAAAEAAGPPPAGAADQAAHWVAAVRADPGQRQGVNALLREYDLSTAEGIALLCLAEALLRIPDADSADLLIHEKLAAPDWARHLGHSDSLFVNATTWALLFGERLVEIPEHNGLGAVLHRLAARVGEPLIRVVARRMMRVLGEAFVLGEDLGEALRRAARQAAAGYRHSFDMLGEAARTAADAADYLAAYREAIAAAGALGGATLCERPGVSIKLSALHPRYEFAQRGRVLAELLPRLRLLCQEARAAGIALTLDAEEADRLPLQIELLEAVGGEAQLRDWNGLGLAVQAYQKCALPLLDRLAAWARSVGRQLQVRLVKGAYWDSEIKLAQEQGLTDYPVFTRKAATDLHYLLCAQRLLAAPEAFYPQFATHNAHTLAAVLALAPAGAAFECQRLHGMGEALYGQVRREYPELACRIYAPVGSHDRLLAYLVRRLLENGANSSFVNRIQDPAVPIAELVEDPAAALRAARPRRHPRIPVPAELLPGRRNSAGLDLTAREALAELGTAMAEALRQRWQGGPLIDGRLAAGDARPVRDPAARDRVLGDTADTRAEDVARALAAAQDAASDWERTPAETRAGLLERIADAYEAQRPALLALLVREAGKTLPDAVAEVREAVDFCRYYAAEARRLLAAPQALPGPTGERNRLALRGRGPFVCISPWNFPLAIFTGQIAAALAAGNPVLAKPAEQTPLIATFATRLMHQAGVPGAVLQLLPGDGATLGGLLLPDARVQGVAFTGSTAVARLLARQLAARDGPLVPLIAETGGQNAMIVDSTALPEQVTRDVLRSAFTSAGQRCSALRVLCLQEEIAERTLDMLRGAIAELRVGDPGLLETDVGPVIDEQARAALLEHRARLAAQGRLLAEAPLPEATAHGCFVAPALLALERIDELTGEVFGPFVHLVRYRAAALDELVDQINATGYGLTLGVHSRIDARAERIRARARAGNVYVNRNLIGAVVGCQPFGGVGLSGTGPKAGGPHYLPRFTWEQTLSVDTTAAGGNASLFAQGAD
ncbi:MAG: bifunctional proline dehydrogenase/L-glutamate gamma-semialdehyde dehydrogenase PutA [Porticoccaceae bacterium]